MFFHLPPSTPSTPSMSPSSKAFLYSSLYVISPSSTLRYCQQVPTFLYSFNLRYIQQSLLLLLWYFHQAAALSSTHHSLSIHPTKPSSTPSIFPSDATFLYSSLSFNTSSSSSSSCSSTIWICWSIIIINSYCHTPKLLIIIIPKPSILIININGVRSDDA